MLENLNKHIWLVQLADHKGSCSNPQSTKERYITQNH